MSDVGSIVARSQMGDKALYQFARLLRSDDGRIAAQRDAAYYSQFTRTLYSRLAAVRADGRETA